MSKTRKNNRKKKSREESLERRNAHNQLDLTAFEAVNNIVEKEKKKSGDAV